jgi:hypothetical protein
MKLELKHLAVYLPYKLKVSKFHTLNFGNGIGSLSHVLTTKNDQYKPILRPLSDLAKEIEVDEEKFIPIKKLDLFYGQTLELDEKEHLIAPITQEPYVLIRQLFEWHFDVFGLINAGLAVDINTVKF